MEFRLWICLFLFFSSGVSGQAELQAWGNLTGIRVEGQLMPFESLIRVVGSDGISARSTGKEEQSPKFYRDSAGVTVSTKLGSIAFTEKVRDISSGKIVVGIRYLAGTDSVITGSYFCFRILLSDYPMAAFCFDLGKPIKTGILKPDIYGDIIRMTASSFSLRSAGRQLRVNWKGKDSVFLRNGSDLQNPSIEIVLPLQTGSLRTGETAEKEFVVESTGTIDRKEIHLQLDTAHPGRIFDGLGGNFRIQNLKTDPAVIDYCLNNLRVAWGRVEMPWRFWQPDKNGDPVAAAKAGRLDDHVRRAMEMAKKLQDRGIPIILTDWAAPDWGIVGKQVFIHRDGAAWGNPLNSDSLPDIYKSIADYIQYLQDEYGVLVRFFSFNESDLGIYIRQTGEQHDNLIKGLGQYFVSRGLKTKMLLGDNSDATTYAFIGPALKDIASHAFIGAVSFHSWRGWETATLAHWAAASREINLPLVVGEGSIDAAAWAYPAIFLEETYAMEEINLYIRLMGICQPVSILQWQLTSDYSPLTGGGVFGKSGPLEPTQRFWNLKQLASTPEGLNYLPVSCDRPAVTCAALGSREKGNLVMHIVNNGAERKVVLNNIPKGIHSFKSFRPAEIGQCRKGNRYLYAMA